MVTVKRVVLVLPPTLFVAPAPTAKTAASPSVNACVTTFPLSAPGPAEPSVFLAQGLVSQVSLSVLPGNTRPLPEGYLINTQLQFSHYPHLRRSSLREINSN